MIRFQDISIKRKLVVIIMVASTVALLLVSAGFVTYELITYPKTMTRDLTSLADIIEDHCEAALQFSSPDAAEKTLAGLEKKGHIIAAALYDENGKLFAQYPKNAAAQPVYPNAEPLGARFEGDSLILFHPITVEEAVVGTLFLKSDLREKQARFREYAKIILLITIASFVITYVLSSLLQRIISRPISHLAETALDVSQRKNYTVRATKSGNDELGQLIDGFNEMLGQIQERDAALQESNEQLELRVEARTRDLRGEIAVRQRAEAGLQQQFARISLLNQITHAISERQDTDSILHVVLRQLEDHMALDLGAVALFDAPAQSLNVAALRVKNSRLATRFELHPGSVLTLAETGFQICEQGQTVYLHDTLKAATPLADKLAVTGWRSAVAVPLLVENKLFGVLLAARLKLDGFSSGDCEFLRMLSDHVALAAHQAQLHKDLESAYNELRQTQATVMQQERLKALGQMASGIAHDVNNALSPVVGFSDLILRGEHGLSANGKKFLKHIRTAGEDIAHIVARLREFYRKREDKETMQVLNLNALAEQVVDMTRPRWRDIPQSNGVTIEVETELATEVPNLVGIESEVREAMTNLVLNAVDAMPKGGKITLRTQVSRPTATAGEVKYPVHVVVELRDTGTGMNEETRKRCLEPFFSTKGKRGTGLGLAMVYGVMERHEGRIEIDSELGQGTTFRLIFPVRSLLSATGTEVDTGALPEPMQILCIDDEPLLRELIKEILERDGHSVEVSDCGQSGLDAFRLARERGRPFDVVFTDLGMPYLDGKQVARMLKHESPGTPVVMLTGWGAFMKEDGDAPAQVDGVLSKPPRSREIRETLCRLQTARTAPAK
jgi:signal transduction histidine kinase/ActR/RegA family two-component response regulator/HAMP domain-containing protein